jgi:nickel/cobalt exporter
MKKFLLLLLCVFFCSYSIQGQAHPLPNGVNHNTSLAIENNQLLLKYNLLMYYTDLDVLYKQIDLDSNNQITDEEKSKWLVGIEEKLFIETNAVTYKAQKLLDFSNYLDIKDSVYPTVTFTVSFGNISLPSDLVDFKLHNKYRIQSGDPQDWNFSFDQQSIYIEDVKVDGGELVSGKWRAAQTSSPTPQNQISTNIFSYDGARNFLDSSLKDPNLGGITLVSLIFVSMLFGAAHTLTPGHGKSIIGAYMAAIRGTFKDAVIMATSTTLSHTGTVIGLGLIFVFLKNGLKVAIPFINQAIQIPSINVRLILPYLNIISGLAIIGIGLWMFRKRVNEFVKTKVAEETHKKLHEQKLDHQHDALGNHSHTYEHEDNHTHSHHHNHTHDHGSHTHDIPDHRLTLKEAIMLGLSTGLSPCIDAIAILILAINLDKTALGIGIIFAFSFGMAATLIAIGWLVGHGIKSTKRFAWSKDILLWIPMISSLLIALTGLLLLIQTRG